LQPEEFERRARMDCFALQWGSHGLRYGIGVEIDAWMKTGNTVLVNGSRAYLPQACERYPGLQAVQVSVDPMVLRQRLSQRGRESAAEIEGRLLRAVESFEAPAGCALARLDNNGRPQDAARELLALARGETAAATEASAPRA
jgi:ribose 1,5-bisphosphokinase